MAEKQSDVLMGAYGWLHLGWQNNFYPNDLPQDWQLAYYANEFSMIVIREQEWAQIEDIAALREDCPADFRFVVELPTALNQDVLAVYIDRVQQLGEQCAGVIIPADQINNGTDLPETIPYYMESEIIKVQTGTSLKQLRVLLETALHASSRSPALLIAEGEPPDIELLRSAKIMLELL